MVYQPFKKKWKKKEQFHTSSERKGCCSSCFPQNDWKYLGLLCVFSHVTLGFFAVSILCWVLHTDLKWGKSKNVLTCYLFSSYNISLEALKNPGGIFFSWDVAQAASPTILPREAYSTTNKSANPTISTLYVDMLVVLTHELQHDYLCDNSLPVVLLKKNGIKQGDQSCCLYLEQCSVERLIRRSPNNSNGDGIVCDWCEFVTLYVCARECVCVRERGRERQK